MFPLKCLGKEVWMKKLVSFLIACVLGIIFVILSLVLVDICYRPLIIEDFASIVGMIVFVMLLSFGIICYLNQYFDRSEGYASEKQWIGRWAKNTLLASLVSSFLYGCFIYMLEKNNDPLQQEKNTACVLLLVGLVSCATIYYIQNYKKLLTRKTRIDGLIHKSEKYKRRRYTFVVENVEHTEKHVVLKGFVLGTIHNFDELFVYSLSQDNYLARVIRIQDNGTSIRKAKDKKIELFLKKTDQTKEIQVGAVLSDIIENVSHRNENNTENPRIRGMISGYNDLRDDKKYMTMLLWLIANAKLLVAGKCVSNRNGDIMDPLSNNAQVSFMSVSTTADESLFILPAFTDWDALKCWSMMMQEKDAVTLLMDYKEVEGIMEKGFGGIVINPFGPQPFFMPKELASSIVEMTAKNEVN